MVFLTLAAGCEKTERPYVEEAVRTRVIEQGEVYTQWFYDGRYEELVEKFRGSLKDSMEIERLRSMRLELAKNYGPETEVIEQGVGDMGELRIYLRVVHFERQSAPVEVQWTLDDVGDIHGFYLRPAAQTTGSP